MSGSRNKLLQNKCLQRKYLSAKCGRLRCLWRQSGATEVGPLQAGETEDTSPPTLVLCSSAKVSEVVCLGFFLFIFETQQTRSPVRDVLGIAFRWAASHICPSNVTSSFSRCPRGGKYPSGLRQAEVWGITASPITSRARLGLCWGLGTWENSSASFYWLQQALRGAQRTSDSTERYRAVHDEQVQPRGTLLPLTESSFWAQRPLRSSWSSAEPSLDSKDAGAACLSLLLCSRKDRLSWQK